MYYLPPTTIAELLTREAAKDKFSEIAPLLKHVADRIVWQDQRYRALMNVKFGSYSEPQEASAVSVPENPDNSTKEIL